MCLLSWCHYKSLKLHPKSKMILLQYPTCIPDFSAILVVGWEICLTATSQKRKLKQMPDGHEIFMIGRGTTGRISGITILIFLSSFLRSLGNIVLLLTGLFNAPPTKRDGGLGSKCVSCYYYEHCYFYHVVRLVRMLVLVPAVVVVKTMKKIMITDMMVSW